MFEPARLGNDGLKKAPYSLVVKRPGIAGDNMRQHFHFARWDMHRQPLRVFEVRNGHDQFGTPIQQYQQLGIGLINQPPVLMQRHENTQPTRPDPDVSFNNGATGRRFSHITQGFVLVSSFIWKTNATAIFFTGDDTTHYAVP